MRFHRLLSASALAGTLVFASPAFAQAQETQDPTGNDAAVEEQCLPGDQRPECLTTGEADEVIVTGSRIARPNLDASNPVTSVSVADLTSTAEVNIGDALNDLPSLRSTYSQGNSTRFIGTSGLNLLDLRGLGVERTLVLVNNRRHVTSSVGDYLVDVNTIPTDLLERVDIVTGGTSAVYGSDAVAGVVNFVLKRDFQGLLLTGQASTPDEGDRGSQFISLTAGQNFAGGRGNITFSGSYTNSDALYFTDRDKLTGAFRGRSQFNLAETTAGEIGGTDGIPDNQFFNNVKNGTLSDGGLLTAICNAANATNAARCRPNSNAPTTTAGRGQRYVFLPNGDLVLSSPTVDFRDITAGGSSNTVGGLGSTLRNTGQLFPSLERYTANVLARFEVSDAFQPFVEAKYVRVNSFQEGQPSFIQGIPATLGAGSDLRCDNPFLNTQALTTLQSIGFCATPTATFALNRFNVDFGGRRQDVRRETYRIVGGVEGRFNDDWRYEVSVNYGRFDEKVDFLNNLQIADLDGNNAGFTNAADATRNAAGQIVCRVNADATTANDDPACVPINLFGFGAPSQAALDYVQTTGFSNSRAEQFDALAYVSGDLSQLFTFPGGGAAGFSIGGEYRTEKARQRYDPLTEAGGTFLNAIQPFAPPKLEVKEVFGELRLPLLADLPFVRELTLEGAIRYSDYNTPTDEVYAYNVGGIYSPFRGLRIRGNYSKSVRTPTQGDLFSPASQNFAQLADPCDIQNINANPNRAANCAAFGVPANFVNQPARDRTTGFASGGNPTLTEEEGTSFTAGAVFEPTFLPGFAATVDYYNIRVENLIAALGAQAILNQCYDAPGGINNPFCGTVNRDANGFFVEPAVISGGINFARQDTQGIDFELSYNRKFDNGHSVRFNFLGTYVLELTNFVSPTDPNFGDRQLSELGDAPFNFNVGVTYDTGPFQLGYQARYIGRSYISTYEATNSFQGRPPLNADVFQAGQDRYPAITYHNIRAQIDVNDNFNFFAGIDNFTDKEPPFGLLGTAGGDPYDTIGRTFFFGFKAKLR